jgi:hypothetical protein
MEEVFISKTIGADSMTGLMNSRTLKTVVLSQSVHCQDSKNEMSLGIFELHPSESNDGTARVTGSGRYEFQGLTYLLAYTPTP